MLNTGLGVYIPVLLYACFVIACALTFSINPRIGLYLLALVVPLQRVRSRIADYPLGENLITILIICIAIGGLLRGMRPRKNPVTLPLLAMIVYLYFSLWWGTIYRGGEMPLWLDSPRFYAYKDYVAMLLLFVISSQVLRTRRHVVYLLVFFLISLVLVDRSALLEFMTRDLSHYSDAKRASGPFGDLGSNELAAYLAQFALFVFGFASQAKLQRKLRWLFYGVGALTSAALLYAFSRGAYAAFLFGILVFALLRSRKMLVALVLFFACWEWVVPTAVQERVTMTYDETVGLDDSAQQRVQMWKEAMARFQRSPLLGGGYGMFASTIRDNGLRDTHNWYVKVLVDTGIIGLALVLWVLSCIIRTAWRAFKAEEPFISAIGLGLLLALCSLLVANAFGDRWTYIEINGLLWMLLAAAANEVSEHNLLRKEPDMTPEVSEISCAY